MGDCQCDPPKLNNRPQVGATTCHCRPHWSSTPQWTPTLQLSNSVSFTTDSKWQDTVKLFPSVWCTLYLCVCVCACVYVCVRACVRACMRACVCVHMRMPIIYTDKRNRPVDLVFCVFFNAKGPKKMWTCQCLKKKSQLCKLNSIFWYTLKSLTEWPFFLCFMKWVITFYHSALYSECIYIYIDHFKLGLFVDTVLPKGYTLIWYYYHRYF